MSKIRHLPLVLLLLMVGAAMATVWIGVVSAREETEVSVDQDELVLTEFASEFSQELNTLERTYERTLLGLRQQIESGMSEHRLRSVGETYTGVRQISLIHPGRFKGYPFIERSVDVGEGFPQPVLRGEMDRGISLDQLKNPGSDYFWGPGREGESYFVTRVLGPSGKRWIFGIEKAEVVESMAKWIIKWRESAGEVVEVEEWQHQLLAPGGGELARVGDVSSKPDLLFPVSSRFGTWKLLAWETRSTVVSYRQPVLMTAGVIAVCLVLVGVGGFLLLRRVLILAEQRVSFVNRVSHELRTPMTNIMLNLDLALDSVEANTMASQRLSLVNEEIGRLRRLLENVLTFSRRGQKDVGLSMRALGVAEEVGKVLELHRGGLRDQGIEFQLELSDELVVRADQDGFAQILGNLFSNVEKYGGSDSEMIVRAIDDGEQVVIQVEDSGAGVSSGSREKIFRPFTRLSDRTNEGVSGSGLGLAIARDLATEMEGSLVCRARVDGEPGACFELRLPRVVVESGKLVSFHSQAS